MTHIPLTRRTLMAAACGAALLGLAACTDQADAPAAFSGIDITGADYATGFSLTDHNGQPRTLTDFKGKVVVVFFGFTQCPDVCPTSMSELAEARRLLGPDGERLQGLFISVDPERDTPEIMKQYMASFDPSFLALYAAPDALPALARSYKVYYKKVDGPTPTSYSMDHSAGSYIYDPQGRIRLYHRYGTGSAALAGDLKRLLAGD
ncbi:MAG: SCO family protein [Hydrogenophaga sp.]|uniref:SCO family protein n=1 Tax=Hydrogenophaga sp. TaxID=1904254 RepID=UPI00261FF3EC|nr:SCO family protein [Hydrogenophaga sp.]MCV0440979.1 SCO family protein [Hydrogenophaga sp.]